jgi:hypothetical protein
MVSSKREAKKVRRNRMMIGAITIFVMLGGGLGIFASNIGTKENAVSYNEMMFEFTERGWMTKINGEKIYFTHHPLEVENIELNNETLTLLKEADNILLSYNPNSIYSNIIANAQYFLSENLAKQGYGIGNGFNIETQYQVPLITCENASKENIVILFEESSEISIEVNEYCILGYSNTDEGFYRISNRLLYGLMNIIK